MYYTKLSRRVVSIFLTVTVFPFVSYDARRCSNKLPFQVPLNQDVGISVAYFRYFLAIHQEYCELFLNRSIKNSKKNFFNALRM